MLLPLLVLVLVERHGEQGFGVGVGCKGGGVNFGSGLLRASAYLRVRLSILKSGVPM